MGLFDELKRLARPYDDDEYEDYKPRASEKIPVSQPQQSSFSNVDTSDKRNKVVNIHATAQLQVVLVKPERFENSTEIADHLRDKRTVVLNLENTPKEVARRVLDFLSGVAYAQDGKIKKVAVSTYIITPYNVDILGDLIDELENNGLYF
jgi:cell division inhibitor SepF